MPIDSMYGSFRYRVTEIDVQFSIPAPHVLNEVFTTQSHRPVSTPLHDERLSFQLGRFLEVGNEGVEVAATGIDLVPLPTIPGLCGPQRL